MRILLINAVCGTGSTGRICAELAERLTAEGHEVRIAYGRNDNVPEQYRKYAVRIGNDWDCRIHALQTRLFDTHGFGSKRATRKFLKWAEAYDPDLVWLHNIHGYYINVELLFAWIKSRPQMQVKWTLHDCWSFTGHCAYFTAVGCEKWQAHCEACPQEGSYPACKGMGNASRNYDRKRAAFTGVENLTVITPCEWLKGLVLKSFLKDYPVEVCYNTVDTNVFKSTPSDFRTRHGLEGRTILLGVASIWEERKGLKDFVKLAMMLDERYVIVLVGVDERQIGKLREMAERLEEDLLWKGSEGAEAAGRSKTAEGTEEQKSWNDGGRREFQSAVVEQTPDALYEAITGHKYYASILREKPARILPLPRTSSSQELAAIYTAADVFLNPTHEDNYPTVNLEALACGTPVITYDTGGAAETIREGSRQMVDAGVE